MYAKRAEIKNKKAQSSKKVNEDIKIKETKIFITRNIYKIEI